MSDTALVIIDVQSGLLKDENYPPYDGDGLVQRLSGVIEKARGAGVPVIYVQHLSLEPHFPCSRDHVADPQSVSSLRNSPTTSCHGNTGSSCRR